MIKLNENNKIVIKEDKDIRLDLYLLNKYKELSRNKIQNYIKNGNFLINNKKVKTGYLLKEGDILTSKNIIINEEITYNLKPINLNLEVIYEDDDLAIINKPKDLVVHPAKTFKGTTLVNGLLYQFDKLSTINGEKRPGIIHRLDKDTSGLLIITKSNLAHKILSEDISMQKIKRYYYAICYGTFSEKTGEINMPIKRDPKDRIKMAVVKDGKESLTKFEVLEQYLHHSLLKIQLITGRTHQIRVHLSEINHPILGDETYGPKNIYGNIGQYLHAYKLKFNHPITKKEMVFETPLPKYFKDTIIKLSQ